MKPTTRRALLKGSLAVSAAVPVAAAFVTEAPVRPADPFFDWFDRWTCMRDEHGKVAKRYTEALGRIPKAVQEMAPPHLGAYCLVEEMEAFRDIEAAKHEGTARQAFVEACNEQIKERRRYEKIRRDWEARVGAPEAEEELMKIDAALDDLECKILTTPGTSLAAVVAKLRIVCWRIGEEPDAFDHQGLDVDRQGIVTALDAAERTLAS